MQEKQGCSPLGVVWTALTTQIVTIAVQSAVVAAGLIIIAETLIALAPRVGVAVTVMAVAIGDVA